MYLFLITVAVVIVLARTWSKRGSLSRKAEILRLHVEVSPIPELQMLHPYDLMNLFISPSVLEGFHHSKKAPCQKGS